MFDKCIIIWISSSSLPKSMPEVLISLLCFTNETIFLLIKPKVKPIFKKITVEHIEKKTTLNIDRFIYGSMSFFRLK